jgi:tetrapyrrole methylase family protein / MazG family protein
MNEIPFPDARPIDRLIAIMRRLRGPDGCPWDREQTLQSLKKNLVEETYEVIDAIDSGDAQCLREELGDLLLQVVFQAQICSEEDAFDFQDVAAAIADKLVRRHPHVFGDAEAADAAAVHANWDRIKRSEQGDQPRSAVAGVPRHLPALHKAQHVQARVARVGFDWRETADVLAKIEEELAEIKMAMAEESATRVRDEIGDLLFAVVNLTRYLGHEAEEVLNETVARFSRRFQHVEDTVHGAGRKLTDHSLEELEAFWQDAKAAEAHPDA